MTTPAASDIGYIEMPKVQDPVPLGNDAPVTRQDIQNYFKFLGDQINNQLQEIRNEFVTIEETTIPAISGTNTQMHTYSGLWYGTEATATSGTWYDLSLQYIDAGASGAWRDDGYAAMKAGTGKLLSVVFYDQTGHDATNVSFRFKSGTTTTGAPVVADIAEKTPTEQDADGTLTVVKGEELILQMMQDDGETRKLSVSAVATFGVEVTPS